MFSCGKIYVWHPDHPLQSVDLRLLRIFQLVVRFNGFSAAQEPGMTQATISAQ